MRHHGGYVRVSVVMYRRVDPSIEFIWSAFSSSLRTPAHKSEEPVSTIRLKF